MTTDPITESGMIFGPYVDGYCFHIEKSTTYEEIQEGVRIAEFLLIRAKDGHPKTVWVVEAKSSSPRPETLPNFDEFIDEIKEKLTNAFTLGLAMCLSRHTTSDELPEQFKVLDLSNLSFRLVLVINGHQEAWLEPLQNVLTKALRPLVKTWALPATAVAVINDSKARQEGLIQ